ncbi:aldo/keto reductase [Nonomuraea ferruginea]
MRIALGTIPFGTTVSEKDTFAILDRFVEAGGRMLDTADNYPFWEPGRTGDESELAIGAWLAARGNRDQVYLSTKVGARPTVPGDVTLDSAEGLSAAAIRTAIEGSLRRLGTDRVDLYWAHIEDRSVPLEETLGTFEELVQAGRALAIGASNLPSLAAGAGQERLGGPRLDPVHAPAAPAHLPAPAPVHEARRERSHAHHGRAPGLPGGHRGDAVGVQHADVRRLHPRGPADPRHLPPPRYDPPPGGPAPGGAGARRDPPNQVVLAWLLADGHVPIVGVSSMAQLEEAIAATELKLDDDLKSRLDTPPAERGRPGEGN